MSDFDKDQKAIKKVAKKDKKRAKKAQKREKKIAKKAKKREKKIAKLRSQAVWHITKAQRLNAKANRIKAGLY